MKYCDAQKETERHRQIILKMRREKERGEDEEED